MLGVFDAFAVVCDDDDDGGDYSDDDDYYYCGGGGGDGGSSKNDDESYLYIMHTSCQLIMKYSHKGSDVYDDKLKLLCFALPQLSWSGGTKAKLKNAEMPRDVQTAEILLKEHKDLVDDVAAHEPE